MTSASSQPPKGRLAVASWVVFDIGQSLFYVAVVGLFFPLWVTRHLGGDDATVGFTMAAAMLFMLVIGPVAGAFSDQMGRRKPFLIASTLVCIGSTLLMGGDSLAAALTLFGLAVLTVNTASIFYNALLVNVSSEATRGTVSGVGVGVGYLGAVLAVATGLIFVQSGDYAVGFRIIGVIFILTSLPLFLFLKETPQHEEGLPVLTKAERTFEQLRSTLGLMSRVPGMTRFILVRFWYVWAVNTASTFAILYGTDTVGFEESKVELVLLVGILVAIPSSFVWGRMIDRFGPRRLLNIMLIGWLLSLLASAGIPWLGLPSYLWWAIGVASGILVSGVWTVDRPYILRLVPPSQIGEFFGIHSAASRLSAIAGPFTWGLISVTLGLGQIAAVLSLVGCIAIALILARGVLDKAEVGSQQLRL